MKKIGILFLFVLAFFIVPQKTSAQECQVIYGGGTVCPPTFSFSLEKKVWNPTKGGGFVSNLSINDAKYGPDNLVYFQITLTNTGNTTLPSVTINDTFPNFVDFAGGVGNFDKNTKTLTIVINNLEPGKQESFVLIGRTVKAEFLPQDQGVVCVVNQARASAQGKVATANSQFCIEKPVLGVVPTPQVFPAPKMVVTPPTGPDPFSLSFLLSSGALGFWLRKRSSRNLSERR
jgi:hypothetical protein